MSSLSIFYYGPLASKENREDVPMDEKDNENPGAEKLFVMLLLSFMVFQYSFQNSVDQLKVWYVPYLLKKPFFLQMSVL